MWQENCIVSPVKFVKTVQKLAQIKEKDLFTGYEHLKLDRDQVKAPSIEEIEDAVVSNEHLRELAEDHNLVEIHYNDDTEDYMEYYSAFN